MSYGCVDYTMGHYVAPPDEVQRIGGSEVMISVEEAREIVLGSVERMVKITSSFSEKSNLIFLFTLE